RGGTVFTHLRLCRDGVNGASPLIPRGRVDLLLGLEPMESLRAAVEYGSRRTTAFISNLPIHTTDTASGRAKYPDTREVFRLISRICGTVYEVNVEGLIRDAGTLMLNVFVLGVVAGSGVLPIPVQTVRRFVQDLDTSVGGNLASFERGVEMGRNLVRV
ncbi:MAG: 2-oxoacid:acceptor oxidoreductase family protein, partial [Candidatus Thorarchaeota archaeon]